MGAVYTMSCGKERFLVSPFELLAMLPPKANYDEEILERILRSLELDGYFELIESDRKGERTYVVHMREAGLAFQRNDRQRRRKLMIRLAVTVLCGVLSAVVGLLIKSILS